MTYLLYESMGNSKRTSKNLQHQIPFVLYSRDIFVFSVFQNYCASYWYGKWFFGNAFQDFWLDARKTIDQGRHADSQPSARGVQTMRNDGFKHHFPSINCDYIFQDCPPRASHCYCTVYGVCYDVQQSLWFNNCWFKDVERGSSVEVEYVLVNQAGIELTGSFMVCVKIWQCYSKYHKKCLDYIFCIFLEQEREK